MTDTLGGNYVVSVFEYSVGHIFFILKCLNTFNKSQSRRQKQTYCRKKELRCLKIKAGSLNLI